MKKEIIESIDIPEGVSCEISGNKFSCNKGASNLSISIDIPKTTIQIKDQKVIFSCNKGGKKEYKIVKSYLAHIKNLFEGINKKFVYKLEACNLHFPMTLKVDKDVLLINNFLGEKVPRRAKILPGVEIEIKGLKIFLSSSSKTSAGQTAANIEKATKIRFRDRRIFQDGIFITEKPGEGS
jgi:large subunit ribosomal protein L6